MHWLTACALLVRLAPRAALDLEPSGAEASAGGTRTYDVSSTARIDRTQERQACWQEEVTDERVMAAAA
jgi:hypothetical protein